jgi:hypothetical protein
MANLMPSPILGDVRSVLLNAGTGKGANRTGMTSYQILEALPQPVRDQLITERGRPGRGCGRRYSAASVVAQAARKLGATATFDDTRSTSCEVAGANVASGHEVSARFRL